MVERSTSKSIEFAFPFALRGFDGLQPAGIYEVETVEEQIEGLSFIAYRRMSTSISLRLGGKAVHARQITEIDPTDLASALERDAKGTARKTNS